MTVKRTNCFYSQGLFLSVPALNSVATKMKMTLGLIKKGGGMHSLLFLPSHPSYTLPRMGVSFKKGWTFLHLIWVVSAPSTPFFLKNLSGGQEYSLNFLAMHRSHHQVPSWPGHSPDRSGYFGTQIMHSKFLWRVPFSLLFALKKHLAWRAWLSCTLWKPKSAPLWVMHA